MKKSNFIYLIVFVITIAYAVASYFYPFNPDIIKKLAEGTKLEDLPQVWMLSLFAGFLLFVVAMVTFGYTLTKKNWSNQKAFQSLVLIFFIATGFASLLNGEIDFYLYWGLPIFHAPIIAGTLNGYIFRYARRLTQTEIWEEDRALLPIK